MHTFLSSQHHPKLYLIADRTLLPPQGYLELLTPLIEAGLSMLQFRDKTPSSDSQHIATTIRTLCAQRGVIFILNDNIALAETLKADGIHLGINDLPIKEARQRLGDDVIIGASCYDSLEQAQSACADGADYIAFGALYPTSTKTTTTRITLDQLRRYTAQIPQPVCAIGGIGLQHIKDVHDCGVSLIAMGAGILCQDNPRATVVDSLKLLRQCGKQV